MAYVNFTPLFSSLCSTVAPKIYNVAAVRTMAVKSRTHEQNTSGKTSQIVASYNYQGQDSIVCYLSRLQRLKRNETVTRKDVRFKLPLCCH